MHCALWRRHFSRIVYVLQPKRFLERRALSVNRGMAKILRIKDADQKALDKMVEEVASVISSGGVVAIPTETVYGIAASVSSNEGIQKLYAIKGRQQTKPIAICLSDVEHIDRWANRTVSTELLHELLPGPVTTVFERSELLNPQLNPGNPLVGIRVPDYPFVRQLVAQCSQPLALTSANISNTRSTVAIEEFQDLWPHLDLVIDGGRTAESENAESRRGSTVVNLSGPGKFTIIRKGSSYESIMKVLSDKYHLTEASS